RFDRLLDLRGRRGGEHPEVVHVSFFFFNDTATTEIYTLSLHDALPIFTVPSWPWRRSWRKRGFLPGPPGVECRRGGIRHALEASPGPVPRAPGAAQDHRCGHESGSL